MKSLIRMVGVLALAALAASCSMVRTLDSESGLYDVKLNRNLKAMVDGAWAWGKGNPYSGQKKGAIYIAPLDIRKVEKSQPKLAPLMVPQMHEYIVKYVGEELQKSNAAHGMQWTLTDDPTRAAIRVDMAVVHFRPQRPGLRILSSLGGHFVKVPGVSDVVGSFSKGDICLEMTIRDGKDGTLLLACKDSNRKTARLISADAYSRSGNADANLRYWAQRLANLIHLGSGNTLNGRTLKEYYNDRSWGAVIKDNIMN